MPATIDIQKFYSNARSAASNLIDAIDALKELRAISDANQYDQNLPDGTGFNLGLTKADINPVLYASVDAFNAIDPAIFSNLRKIRTLT